MSINISQTTRFLKIDSTGLVMVRGLLYKYKSLENTKQINYVIELITKQKIFCPKPSQLNDDKEFKPELVIGDLSDTIYFSKVRQWAEKIMSYRHPRPSDEEIQNELTSLTENSLRKLAEESTKDYRQSLDDRYRVVSLSTTPNNHHLWKKYADQDQGICFEFNVNSTLATAYKVDYQDKENIIDLIGDDEHDHLTKTGLVKTTKWEKEEEVRFILADPPISGGPLLIDNKLYIRKHFFTKIIFGFNSEIIVRNRLIGLIKEHLPHVEICITKLIIPYKDMYLVNI